MCNIHNQRRKVNMLKLLTKEEFILRANRMHNNAYSYKNMVYTGMRHKILATCPIHGDFTVQASNHVKYLPNKPQLAPCGCPVCGKEKVIKRNIQGRMSWSEFVKRSTNLHNNRYQYLEYNYMGVEQKVSIVCPVHGEFLQTGSAHLKGSGCPKCKNSLGQTLVATILTQNNVEFIPEHSFVDCIGDIKPLKFDFYIPKYNTLIEYDGEQHYKPVKFHKQMTEKQTYEMFERVQRYDKIKNDYALTNGFILVRIPYTERKNIPSIVNRILHNVVIVGETV